MGQIVLANQFTLRAHFEEAKARELAGMKIPMQKRSSVVYVTTSLSTTQSQAETPLPTTTSTTPKDENWRTSGRNVPTLGKKLTWTVPANIRRILEESRRLMESLVLAM